MKIMKQAAVAATAVGLMAAASVAQAIPFAISSASFTPHGGYGQDRCEVCGQSLDVRFSAADLSAQQFSLNAAGDSKTFAIGTVSFQEPDTYGGIRQQETDNLGVKAFLGFGIPGGKSWDLKFTGDGTARVGAIGDADTDYSLAWASRQISLGSKGLLEISFKELSFANVGTQTLLATFTLLQGGGGSVPEPGSMVLFGLGLAGLGLVRRRKSA